MHHYVTIPYHACVARYELAIKAIIHFNELAGNCEFCVMHMYWLLARQCSLLHWLCVSVRLPTTGDSVGLCKSSRY